MSVHVGYSNKTIHFLDYLLSAFHITNEKSSQGIYEADDELLCRDIFSNPIHQSANVIASNS